jgi:glycerol-3-phosphate acyltransferase PlsY
MAQERTPTSAPLDPLAPLRSPGWLSEMKRKALHLCFIILPLQLVHVWFPWPSSRGDWRVLLIAAVLVAMGVDMVRIHDHRVKAFFSRFFGRMIRSHERTNLLGSTYLLLAALLAIELFPRPVAAAALGFTVLGDGIAAVIGKAYGRPRVFGKSLEGTAAGLAACLLWAAYLAGGGHLPWGVVLAGALTASLVELLPIPLDDNLGMTLFAGYMMKLLWNQA